MNRSSVILSRGPHRSAWFLAATFGAFLSAGGGALADVKSHAEMDALLAEAARLAPVASAVEMNFEAVSPAQYATLGNWSAIIPWSPHIPVSAALLPDGRLLTFASNQRTTFPDGPQFTYAAVWDPATGAFTELNNGRHDMFCGGLALLQDGRLMVNGGNGILGTNPLASLFDWRTNVWTAAQNMPDGRWYNTSVALPNGEVFTASGNGGGNGTGTTDQWNASSGWRRMSGVNWQSVVNAPIPNAIEPNWHPFLLVAPDGRLAHFGPHHALNWINTSGTGSLTSAGATLPGTHYPKQGAWAMYDVGKVLVAGGLQSVDNGTVVNKAFTVNLNGATPVVTPTAPMANARSFANSVILPNGEVMVVGGTYVGEFGSDEGTIFTPEIWNPASGTWRAVADANVPRNYHSLAMLLPDGRVWSGGGGLYGQTAADHRDAQIFTPPQLFNTDGSLATRPQITAAPDRIGPGTTFTVNASPGVQYFSFIRMSSLTHSVSTDLRHLRFTQSVTSPGVYALTAPSSINVLTPGYWMMFGVGANGVWSVSRIVQVTNATLPVVTNPGQQSVLQGGAVSLQINASTAGGTLSYSATSLPAGLSINSATGLISGNVSAAPGKYRSTVLVTASGQAASVAFDWIVVLPNLGSGQIMREWWTEISGATVASLTGNAAFPADSAGRDLLGAFETPQNWDDNTGQRVRGFLHVPVTGQYRFFISSDDQSSLLLSSDDNPLNAVQIASQQDYTPPQTWTWYPQQTSALITLQAGGRYYLEAIVKDGNGDDHLDVGWQKPGDSTTTVIAGTYLSPYLPVKNPAIFWSFEEAAWNGTTGEVKASDQGIYRYGGRAVGGASPTAASPALGGNPGTGGSAVFNGTSQSVVVPYNAALNPRDFTIAAWVRMDGALGAERCILASLETVGATIRGYGLWISSAGNWQLRTGAAALTGPAVVTGKWTHISATFRTTNDTTRAGIRRLYVNGVLTAEDSGVYLLNASGPLVFGAADSPGSAFLPGAVDEVTLHHAPLSLTDVIALRDLRHATNQGPANQSPQMTNPGSRSSILGAVVSLPVVVSDPENNPITFSATGLPTGLTISPTTGVISGSVTAAGVFNVTVTAADGLSTPSSVSFTWTVSNGLTLQTLVSGPKPSGSTQSYTAQASNGVNPRFKWNFGDGTPETAWSSSAGISHAFTNPGRYLVTLSATDDTGINVTSSFYQAVHAALTTRRPNTSSSIVFEDLPTGNDRVWCVNADNNSVSAFDVVTRARYAELAVGTAPRALALAPDGRLWVTNMESATLSIINTSTRTVAATATLPRGSRPFGLVFDPAGTTAWVALEGTGKVVKLNPGTGAVLATVNVAGPVRHLSISADGARVYASRFITPRVAGESTALPDLTGAGGQVVVIGTAALAVERTILLNPSTATDSETSARGLPNYLGAAVISPDGLSAWVPSKQDNIQRGILRDNKPLNHEVTVRSIISRLNLTTQTEHLGSRVDIDNSGMPSAAAYDPWGIYVFTALEASREIVILDAWTHQEILRFPAGRAPQGVTFSPDGNTLYVQNFMDRTITMHDVRGIMQGGNAAPVTLATLNAITTERLAAQVLQGKKLFYDAKDTRLAFQEYMSCATCHNDGGDDGRVWDLTGFGEGLRNTITLKGHANHGALHWTGNFDEVHDFEGQIRTLAGGSGLMTDAQFNTGTRNQPLGDPKVGISADLDALAAYVKSLTTSGNSPHRNSDGSLTADAMAGQQIFRAQNCASCHSGGNFTNSALNVFANIGTLKPVSGKRLGAPVTGLDVPTLRGVWGTAPYLHDGSVATLAEAVRAHQGVSLTDTQIAQVVSFLSQIDDAPVSAPAPLNIVIGTTGNNVTTTFPVTGVLSEASTGFTASDISVTGGSVSGFILSGTTFSFNVTPTASVLRIEILANVMTDSTGLGNVASNVLNLTSSSDVTKPAVTLATASSSVSSAFTVSITASETVTGLTAGDFTVTNGTASNVGGGGAAFTVMITPTVAGSVSVLLPAGTVADVASNTNTASNLLTVNYAPASTPTVVKLQAEDFDEGGEGVAYHDAEAANIGYESSGLAYRSTGVDIEPSEDTDGTPSIGWIAAGEWLRYTTTLSSGSYDINVRMATALAGPSKMRVLINGTPVTTFDITATGGWSAWRTFKVSGINVASAGPATVRIEFPDGGVNLNWIEFVNTTSTPDTTAPSVALTTSSTSVNAPFTVNAAFSESVTGVTLSEFGVTNGAASSLSGSGATYSVLITPAASGTVTVAMPVGAAVDAASNTSLASNTLNVSYSAPVIPAPTVVLTTASSNVTAAFVVNASFNQTVTGVALNDFTVTNGAASALSGSGSAYSVTITPAAAGNVTVRMPAASATDSSGQGNTVSNLLTVNYAPASAPTVVKLQAEDFDEGGEGVAYHDTDTANIGLQSSGLDYRSTGVDIEPSEDTDNTPSVGWIEAGEWLRYTTTLSPGTYDINVRMATALAGPSKMRVLINGTPVTTFDITATGGWSAWSTFKVSGINVASAGPTTVRIEFPDGGVNLNWIEFVNTTSTPDTTPPVVTLTTAASSVSAPFTVSAAFSESVTGVALSDFIVTNGAASSLSGSGATYSVLITPAASGAVTVAMPVGAAFDAAGNVSLASNALSVNYALTDTTPPSVVLSTPSPNVTASFVVTAAFSESVAGLLSSEFVVTNGSVTALSAAGAVWSATVTPTAAGAVTVRLPAGAALDAAGNGSTASNLLTVNYTPVIVTNGLTADYYVGKNFEQFSFTRVDPTLDFKWGAGSPDTRIPADGFTVRWHGCIIPRYTEVYDIISVSDDGVRLWVDGKLLVDNWTDHGESWDDGLISLQAGVPVTVTMEFYEKGGDATARLFWESASQTREVIPQSQLLVNEAGMTGTSSTNTGSVTSVASTTVQVSSSSGVSASSASSGADNDGIPDLLERALGSSTASGVTLPGEGLKLVASNQSGIDATLLRPAGQSGLTFALESTADLVTWTPLLVSPAVVNQGNGWERVTWANLHTLTGQSIARGIIRLRVTQSGGETATGAPVGWQQSSLHAGTQSFGLNLVNDAVFTGGVVSASTTQITLDEQGELPAVIDSRLSYYLEVVSGPQAGHRFDLQNISTAGCVIDTDSSNNTLPAAAVADLTGVRVTLRPHRTLGEVFDPASFHGASIAVSADQVLFYAPTGYGTCWLYANGGERRWVLSGDATLASMNDVLIPPGVGLILQLVSTSPAPFLTTGSVRTTPFACALKTGYNLFANPWPLDTTPARTGMIPSAFVATTAFASADQLQVWKGDANPTATGYIGYWLFQMPGQPVPIWIPTGDASMLSQNNAALLRSGRATFIKAQPKTDRPVWIIPPP
jgi:YVTN family beta-propeller protein